MGSTFFSLHYHIVFSTKEQGLLSGYRKPFRDQRREELHCEPGIAPWQAFVDELNELLAKAHVEYDEKYLL